MKRRSCLHWNYGYPKGSVRDCKLGKTCSDNCWRYERRSTGKMQVVRTELRPSELRLNNNCKWKKLGLLEGKLFRYCEHPQAKYPDSKGRCPAMCKYREVPE